MKQIIEDKAYLNISLDDREIGSMSKIVFKSLIKQRLEMKRLEYLTNLQSLKSKSKGLKFTKDPAPYLVDPLFTKQQANLLFSLRSRTYPTKENCSNQHGDDIWCVLCRIFPCSQSHVLQCPEIIREAQGEISDRNPEWIHGNIDQQRTIIKIYERLDQIRRTKIDSIGSSTS